MMGGKLLVRASSDESLASQNLQRTNSHAHEQPSSSSSQHEHLPPQGKGWGLYWVLQSQEESCLFFIWFIYCLPSLSLLLLFLIWVLDVTLSSIIPHYKFSLYFSFDSLVDLFPLGGFCKENGLFFIYINVSSSNKEFVLHVLSEVCHRQCSLSDERINGSKINSVSR